MSQQGYKKLFSRTNMAAIGGSLLQPIPNFLLAGETLMLFGSQGHQQTSQGMACSLALVNELCQQVC